MNYTELHLHDYYSTLDGLNSPEEYMERAKELGMTHLAQTNHGTLMGHREFQKAARAAGVIPILGVEAYISATDRFDRRSNAKRTDGTNAYNHIILLAQNEIGLKSLYRLNEIAWNEGFYSKPRIDLDCLEEHNEGIIVLSGCLNGLICKAIERDDMETANRVAHRLKCIFGERFFIELQEHNPPKTNYALTEIAKSMGIRRVITSDCHYARKEDLWIEEAMLILSTNPKPNFEADFNKSQKMDLLERFNYLYPDRTMTFEEIEIYLKGLPDLSVWAEHDPEVIESTQTVADMIGDYPFHEALDLLPRPRSGKPDDLLWKKVQEGLQRRCLAGKPEYEDRVKEEFDIIKSKNFSTYFLIVANMIQWAKGQGIMVGPGRGSAAGSLVCYALGITEVDPIKYGLLFFRFINPERNDYPDIDSDFEDRRRGEVKEYLRRQFTNVASIATTNKFQGKNSIKDAARVFRVPVSEVNRATKGIETPPDKPQMFFEAFKKSDKGREFIKKYPEVLRLAENISGRIRGTGMHAAGVVLSKQPLRDFVPIESAKEPNSKTSARIPLVALDMNEAADVGLIKIDALGLKALSVIDDTLEMIKHRHNKEIYLPKIDLEDRKVYEMLSEGYTRGVFQCEAVPYTNLIIKMGGVWSFAELAASNALGRPGAMNTIGPEYIARKNGKSAVTYFHEVMKGYTEETYGEILYQEQVMLTMTELAGMSMSDADKVRKIIGKKKDVKEFDAYKDAFIEGASKNVAKSVAEYLWKNFEAHAGYSFNKSHAVAYSMVSYWTAWLKCYYPLEFMYATLKNESDKDARTEYLIEAKRLGIKVLLPHVNSSSVDFSIEGDALRFGLADIKFISDTSANRLIDYRPYADYQALYDKVMEKGSGLTSRALQGLNAVGAAAFPDNPRKGDERNNFYEFLGIPAFQTSDIPPKIRAQFRPLDEFEETGCFVVCGMVKKIKRGQGWARVELVDESGTAGIFHTENTPIEPGQMYVILVADNRVARYVPSLQILPNSDNTFVQWLYSDGDKSLGDDYYEVVSFQPHTTKAGKKMAYLVLADSEKEMIRALAFPQNFHKVYSRCREGQAACVTFAQTDDGTVYIKDCY